MADSDQSVRSSWAKRILSGAAPIKAMVEIVRACNLHCPLCPVGNGSANRFPHMKREVFESIIDVISPTVVHLSLYNYGEPLLHPEVAEFVRIAKAAGIKGVEITTNGTIVPDGLPDGLVAAGLDFLRISIDGATEESYRAYRVGGSLSKVWHNLERFRAARQRACSEKPLIEVQMVVNKHNEGEMEVLGARATEAGADAVRFKTFNAKMSGPAYVEEGKSLLPKDRRLSRYVDYENLDLRTGDEPGRCRRPWSQVVINADGTIVPCCYDFNGKHRLGSADDMSPDKEWWLTPERLSFRERLRQDPGSIDMCSACPLGGAHGGAAADVLTV